MTQTTATKMQRAQRARDLPAAPLAAAVGQGAPWNEDEELDRYLALLDQAEDAEAARQPTGAAIVWAVAALVVEFVLLVIGAGIAAWICGSVVGAGAGAGEVR